MKLVLSRKDQVVLALVWMLVIGCSSNKMNPNMTPEERFDVAMKYLKKGDYFRARTQFQILVFNYPGTRIADKAQFYLAESHYGAKEYILAAAEYEKMIRNYPNSKLVDDAQYKLGMCYYKLSPHYQLDQKYTYSAINEFQRFLEEYPTSELKEDVEKKLAECRMKLAHKEFAAGEQYRKMGYDKAAVIYYDLVLQEYYDSPYAEEAMFRKGVSLMKLEKWEEAEKVFQVFLAKYPKSRFVEATKDNLKQLQKKLSDQG